MARVTSIVCFVLAVVGVMFISAGGVWAADDCQSDLNSLGEQCGDFLEKEEPTVPPSKGCCDVVRKIDIPACVCSHITPDVERFIDMNKVVSIAQTCGRPFAPGTKCGSFTVPMA